MRVRETDGGASGLSGRPPPFPEHPGRAGSQEQLGRAEDDCNASQRPDGVVRKQRGDENAAEQIDEASLARTIGPVEHDLGDSPVRSRWTSAGTDVISDIIEGCVQEPDAIAWSNRTAPAHAEAPATNAPQSFIPNSSP